MPEEKKVTGTETEEKTQVQGQPAPEIKTYTKEELDRAIQSAVETNMKKMQKQFVSLLGENGKEDPKKNLGTDEIINQVRGEIETMKQQLRKSQIERTVIETFAAEKIPVNLMKFFKVEDNEESPDIETQVKNFKSTLDGWINETIKKNNTTFASGNKEVKVKEEESRIESIKKDIDQMVKNGVNQKKKFFES